MKLLALETIIQGRAAAQAGGLDPPYVCHLPPKRAARLRRELDALGVSFGLPLDGFVPDPREEDEWTYLGIVLDDVHVFARASAAR